MTATLTIPKKLAEEGDLVILPLREYVAFKKWRKKIAIKDEDAWFWTSEWQKKEAEATEDIKNGRVHGPFKSHKAMMVALNKKPK
ncbi:MAG: hypothetical protein A2749_03005 [Parcubacteria group bacterium RIFCSPHIGHO2_01_FULL_45_26]|nr:MAG: hypothetical protein A2749_03005 [Parcubacteria group bacterium RIFCSPHIGHO2_01_FULL_45_26]